MSYSIPILAGLFVAVVLWLLIEVVRRGSVADRHAPPRARQPPTMPPRPSSVPHVSTMPYGESPRLSDSEIDERVRQMMRERAERFAHTHLAHQARVIADTGDKGLDAILNAPEPDPRTLNARQLAEACGVPARMLRGTNPDWPYPPRDTERRASRPPLDHSSDADPWMPPQ